MSPNQPIRPPFDPELVPVLNAVRQAVGHPRTDSLHQVRTMMREGAPGVPRPDLTAGGAVVVADRDVPGPDGAPDITLLILTPAQQTGPSPAIYFIHAGGMVVGHRRGNVELFLPYVTELGAVVVSVEYRLAPEHPDPAPLQDCYAGLVWTARNAEELGVDADRILIAGASAGGGLAAGTALIARDRGFPNLTHQVLICPMLDDRLQTPSSQMLDDEGLWDRHDNLFGWTALLGERRGTEDVSIYAAPARAQDLSGLPHSYVDVGTAESFRDEAVTYAQRLAQAGPGRPAHVGRWLPRVRRDGAPRGHQPSLRCDEGRVLPKGIRQRRNHLITVGPNRAEQNTPPSPPDRRALRPPVQPGWLHQAARMNCSSRRCVPATVG